MPACINRFLVSWNQLCFVPPNGSYLRQDGQFPQGHMTPFTSRYTGCHFKLCSSPCLRAPEIVQTTIKSKTKTVTIEAIVLIACNCKLSIALIAERMEVIAMTKGLKELEGKKSMSYHSSLLFRSFCIKALAAFSDA